GALGGGGAPSGRAGGGGGAVGGGPPPRHAAAARAVDLSGLPPAYIATAEFDPLRDEEITYTSRLLQAGVSVELHQWPGTFHGSEGVLSAEGSQRQVAEFTATLRPALVSEMVAAHQAGPPSRHKPPDEITTGRTSRHDS